MKERKNKEESSNHEMPCGCPGHAAKEIKHKHKVYSSNHHSHEKLHKERGSELRQWPVQIKLVATNAPYFKDSHVLIAADCTAFAYANIHEDFMKGKITLIGCPKLDFVDYSEKLAEIFKNNEIKSITVLRMQVPCCSGLVNAVTRAMQASGKMIPWSYKIVTSSGELLEG